METYLRISYVSVFYPYDVQNPQSVVLLDNASIHHLECRKSSLGVVQDHASYPLIALTSCPLRKCLWKWNTYSMQTPVYIVSPQILNCWLNLHLVVLHKKIVLVTLNMLGTCNFILIIVTCYSLLVASLSLLLPFFVIHTRLRTAQHSRAVIGVHSVV